MCLRSVHSPTKLKYKAGNTRQCEDGGVHFLHGGSVCKTLFDHLLWFVFHHYYNYYYLKISVHNILEVNHGDHYSSTTVEQSILTIIVVI